MIDTERTHLRPIRKEDNQQIFAYRSDAETNKYQSSIPKSLADTDAFIAKNPDTFNKPNTWFQLVIIEQASNKIIGDIGIHFIGQDNLQCEIGCTLDKNYHGRGFATESLKAVVDYLFTRLKKHRIVASVDPRNIASMNMVERLGFRKEGHFVKSLFIDGQWVDDVIYAMLLSEWE